MSDRRIIRIDLAAVDADRASVVEQLYEEVNALRTEIENTKRVLAMVLDANGPALLTTHHQLVFDPDHTDIIEERTQEGLRYSIEKWGTD